MLVPKQSHLFALIPIRTHTSMCYSGSTSTPCCYPSLCPLSSLDGFGREARELCECRLGMEFITLSLSLFLRHVSPPKLKQSQLLQDADNIIFLKLQCQAIIAYKLV